VNQITAQRVNEEIPRRGPGHDHPNIVEHQPLYGGDVLGGDRGEILRRGASVSDQPRTRIRDLLATAWVSSAQRENKRGETLKIQWERENNFVNKQRMGKGSIVAFPAFIYANIAFTSKVLGRPIYELRLVDHL
jgi:hypothetical protein